MKPARMQKVRIILLKSHVDRVIQSLHEAGMMEIRDTRVEGMDEGRPLPFFDEVSGQLVRLRNILAVLEGSKSPAVKPGRPSLMEGRAAVGEAKSLKIDEQLRHLTSEAARISEEISAQRRCLETAGKLNAFKSIDFSALRTKTLDYRVGEMPASKLARLDAKLSKALDNYSLVSPPSKADTVPALILYKKGMEELDALLQESGFTQFEVPPDITTPGNAISSCHAGIRANEAKSREISASIRRIADENYPRIKDLIYSLDVAAARSEISSKFSFTGRMCALDGWVEETKLPKLEEIIARMPHEAYMERLEAGHDEVPPTVLDNPKQAGPFEFLTRSYSFPNYFDMDPSLIYMITVPILYGMIVGDVVYGLISLVIAKWLMGKFKNSYVMSNVAMLWFISAFPTIFFGLVFDEWCGTSLEGIAGILHQWGLPLLLHGPLYHGFHRVERLTELIGITALIGLAQLAIGFILGAVINWNHHRKHSYAKLAWLGIEIGGTVAVCAMILNVLPAAYGSYGLGLFAVCTVALFLTEGIAGVMEIPGLMGNILSYARIAAIGVVGVILAEIINEFLLPVPSQGIFVLLFLPLFVIMHGLNAFIAMFEALIQGGRLNLLEFRSKFMAGGGIPFKPFGFRSE